MKHHARMILVAMLIVLVFPACPGAQESGDFLGDVLKDSRFSWESTSEGDITIYYQDGSFAQRHRMMILSGLRASIPAVLDILGETGYEDHLNVFYLESRDEMEALIGRPYTGFAHWTASSIFLVLNPEWRSFERHEFAHIVTMGRWGRPDKSSYWMIEGIPVFCDGWCRNYSIHQIAFSMLRADQLPDLSELFTDYASLGEIRAGFTSASIVAFIVDEYGTDKLRELWRDGTDSIEEILGEKLSTLGDRWRDHINSQVHDEVEVDLESIRRQGCG